MADPKPKPQSPLETSGIVARDRTRRPSYPGGVGASPAESVRALLLLAIYEQSPVVVTLHVDVESTEPPRTISGLVKDFRAGADGRERVSIVLGDDVEQLILVERIGHVDRAE